MESGGFYGQFGTDAAIAGYFPAAFVGTCVEVGAADGIICSNTLHFEQRGWRALCVEPNPLYHDDLKRNRALVAPFACGAAAREDADFHVFRCAGGNFAAISGLSVDQALVSSHAGLIEARYLIGVPVRPLDWILDSVGGFDRIDFVSIDTEGSELDVLAGFDLARWRPRLLVIENNGDDQAVQAHLAARGYRKAQRVVVNDFYVPVTPPPAP